MAMYAYWVGTLHMLTSWQYSGYQLWMVWNTMALLTQLEHKMAWTWQEVKSYNNFLDGHAKNMDNEGPPTASS